jgi:hypothetical protein
VQIGFVLHEKGEFVEDLRPKPNLGDLLFTISDLLFRPVRGGLAGWAICLAMGKLAGLVFTI